MSSVFSPIGLNAVPLFHYLYRNLRFDEMAVDGITPCVVSYSNPMKPA
jgi:hypothetical protein